MAGDEHWHVHSVTPTDENRLCWMLMVLCAKSYKIKNKGMLLRPWQQQQH